LVEFQRISAAGETVFEAVSVHALHNGDRLFLREVMEKHSSDHHGVRDITEQQKMILKDLGAVEDFNWSSQIYWLTGGV